MWGAKIVTSRLSRQWKRLGRINWVGTILGKEEYDNRGFSRKAVGPLGPRG